MKFTITFKDPDGVGNDIGEAVANIIPENLEQDEKEALIDIRLEKVRKKLSKWITYDEYITIEFDLDTGTATVKEADDS